MFFFKPNVEKLKEKRDVEGLVKALRHKDPSIRRKAARALGELKAKDALDALINALIDEDVAVRLEVVRALGKIKDERAIDHLLKVLRKDESLDVKIEAAKALKEIGYSKATEILIDSISKSLKIPTAMAEKMVKEGKLLDAIAGKKDIVEKFLKRL